MPTRNPEPCISCKEQIETNESGVVITLRCRTIGIAGRLESDQGQVYLCVECAVALALRDDPPRSPLLNMMAHQLICELVARDPVIAGSSWQALRRRLKLPPAIPEIRPELTEGEIMPPSRAALLAG